MEQNIPAKNEIPSEKSDHAPNKLQLHFYFVE